MTPTTGDVKIVFIDEKRPQLREEIDFTKRKSEILRVMSCCHMEIKKPLNS